jgi:hypothetical protein
LCRSTISAPAKQPEGFSSGEASRKAKAGVREVQENTGFYGGKLNLPDLAKAGGESSRAAILNEKSRFMVASLGDVKRPARRRRINRLFEKRRIQMAVRQRRNFARPRCALRGLTAKPDKKDRGGNDLISIFL